MNRKLKSAGLWQLHHSHAESHVNFPGVLARPEETSTSYTVSKNVGWPTSLGDIWQYLMYFKRYQHTFGPRYPTTRKVPCWMYSQKSIHMCWMLVIVFCIIAKTVNNWSAHQETG